MVAAPSARQGAGGTSLRRTDPHVSTLGRTCCRLHAHIARGACRRRRQRREIGAALVRRLSCRGVGPAAGEAGRAAVQADRAKALLRREADRVLPSRSASENAEHGTDAERGGGPRGLYRETKVAASVHAACFIRLTSGATASSASMASAASSG